MKLYNTLTKKVETITPLDAPTVTVYSCGPTVYDYSHVGHWFTYVRTDTLIRTLRQSFTPKTVMNITDVGHLVSDTDEGEDKLEKGAKREGKTAWEVAEFYTKDFTDGLRQLNILMPQHFPKATDHIKEQIALIQLLEQKGFTYIIDDGVYFDTSKFPTYSKFAHLELDKQEAGARVAFNSQKRNPSDFALWKFSPKGSSTRDMEWESPWGKGFPGWHIECSAMSMKYLGNTIDIHTGGIDHIPVHHTNEIAQSEAANDQQFVRHWMHSNHIMIDGKKISKSLGNGIRLQEIVQKGYSPMALRLLVLESHYRSQSVFSWDNLSSAANRLKGYQAMADLRFQPQPHAKAATSDITTAQKDVLAALADDLNTPRALKAVSRLSSTLDISGNSTNSQEALNGLLKMLDDTLGLQLLGSKDITRQQKDIIALRAQARAKKDWATSDDLRDQLKEQGIELRDMPYGQVWSRN